MNYDLTKLYEGLKQLHMSLSKEQVQQFLIYYQMLIEKNKVMNLTAITDYEEVVEKHFIDSLSLVQVADLERKMTVLDLGTGAGFPGIPLKIAFPNLKIVLLDSLNKRVLFLRDVIDALGLQQIEAVHGRAEELARKKEYRECFDLCTSRAVANLASLSEYCIPFLKVGGIFAAYKSGEVETELQQAQKAIDQLGGTVKQTYHFQLPNTDVKRSFVIIAKERHTPKAYPRKAGTPAKNPILS